MLFLAFNTIFQPLSGFFLRSMMGLLLNVRHLLNFLSLSLSKKNTSSEQTGN